MAVIENRMNSPMVVHSVQALCSACWFSPPPTLDARTFAGRADQLRHLL